MLDFLTTRADSNLRDAPGHLDAKASYSGRKVGDHQDVPTGGANSMKVLIIDELAVVRTGLKQVLKRLDDNARVLEADTIADARELLATSEDLDLIVVDALAAAGGGVKALHELVANRNRAPVVVFSHLDDADVMLGTIEAGAKAFLPKTSADSLVVGVLSLVLAGGTYLPPEVMAQDRSTVERSDRSRMQGALQSLGALSRRQREIVGLIAEGLSNQAISERSGLSLSTVKAHVAAAMKALGAKSRTQVALIVRNAMAPSPAGPPAYDRPATVGHGLGEGPLAAFGDGIPVAGRAHAVSIANIGHVVRIFLNSIIGFSDMLEGEVLGPLGKLKYKEYAHHISETGSQLLDIIGRIIESAHVEGSAIGAIETWVDVARTAGACERMVGDAAKRARVELILDLDRDLPNLIVNERHFKQILLNLLLHAVACTPPDGSVRLSAAPDPSRGLRISVRDSGPGIAAAERRRILEPFAEAEAAPIPGPMETWFGLSLVKSLAEIHGGELSIESQPGEGTTIAVRFPMERTMLSQGRASRPAMGGAVVSAAPPTPIQGTQ